MSRQAIPLPVLGTMAGFRRFSVAEYHKLTELGVLTEDDNLELLEGYLVLKMPRNPPHDSSLHRALKQLTRALPAGWDLRVQSAVTLGDSEPEPDLALVREDAGGYSTRHPGAADIGLVVEVSDSTLAGDRADKGRIYARAAIPVYWIVNVAERQVEVYTAPSGATVSPGYGGRVDYLPGQMVPVELDGVAGGRVAVNDILP